MDSRAPIRLPTRDVVRVLSLIFGFYILVRLLWIAHPVVFLFFLGVLFGLPLAQGADWLEKRRVPRALGVAVILTAFLGLLTGAGAWMAPILRAQSRELQQQLPEAMDKIDAWLGHRANGVLGILFNEPSPDSLHRKTTRLDSMSVAPETVAAVRLAPGGLVSTDSTRAETVATAGAGSVVRKSTTRTEEVAAGGDLRREITRQFRG